MGPITDDQSNSTLLQKEDVAWNISKLEGWRGLA